MKTKRIPFSIEYYKAHPDCKVVYRDGVVANVLHTDSDGHYPITTRKSGSSEALTHTVDGKFQLCTEGNEEDIFIELLSTTRPFTPEELVPMIGKWLIRFRGQKTAVLLIQNENFKHKDIQDQYEISPVGDGVNWQPMCKEEV